MTEADKKELEFKIECEGFNYAFCYYSDFTEIEDETFHELRKSYVEASKKLKAYIEIVEGVL